jgi:outer membrane lipoprotein carrier protein
MKYLFAFLLLGFVWPVLAQTNQYAKPADSDPEARSVLENLRKKYNAYQSLELSFTLTIEMPEEAPIKQQGKLAQKGDAYRVDLDEYHVRSDGKTVWMHLKRNKEVQIQNADAESMADLLSPKDLLAIYQSNEYVYVLVNEYSSGGRVLQEIEFKPTDRNSEYSKIRLSIDKGKGQMAQVKVFNRDGSRFTLDITAHTPNKTFPNTHFVWSKSECPDCYVEDLRID